MKLRDIMTESVDVISPDATIKEAAKKMDDINVGSLPVCDGERLVGMITDRDIVIRSISVGQDPNSTRVRDAMSSQDLIWCYDDSDVSEAAQKMEERQIRRLPVINRDKKLVGIVALGDLATEGAGKDLKAEVIEGVSEPSKKSA